MGDKNNVNDWPQITKKKLHIWVVGGGILAVLSVSTLYVDVRVPGHSQLAVALLLSVTKQCSTNGSSSLEIHASTPISVVCA